MNVEIKKCLPSIVIIGTFIIANSRFQPGNDGYGIFNILDITKFNIGFTNFELGLLVIAFIIALSVRKQEFSATEKKLFLCAAIMTVIAISSVLLFSKDVAAGLRITLVFLRPMVYFLLFSIVQWSDKDISSLLTLMGIIFFVNLFLSYYQWIFLHYTTDDLQAFMDDAVTFAFLMFAGMLYFIVKYLFTRNKKHIFFAFIALVPALVASTDKITVLFVPTLFATYLFSRELSWKITIKVAGIVIMSLLFMVLISNIIPDSLKVDLLGQLDRLSGLLDMNYADIYYSVGIFEGFRNVLEIYSNNPYSLFVGVGPVNYGSPESDYSSGIYAMMANYRLIMQQHVLMTSAFTSATSDIINIMIEFGAIFFGLYLIFWTNIFKIIKSAYSINNMFYKELSTWLFGCLVMLALLALVTAVDGLGRGSDTIPYFVLLGMLNSIIENREGNL